MKLYNTASRKIEEFLPLGKIVKIYTCGPTVYSFQHIGNYAAYIYWDLLVRILKLSGLEVRRVLNFTDVGHLTSDGDLGEDKLEKGAERDGKSVYEIAKFYEDDFLKNFRKLDLTEPELTARATDYVAAGMRMVDEMTARGFTYETSDGIYFDTTKFPDYAKFARLDLAGLQAGARIGFSTEKRNVSDFAVWKFIQPNERHAMRWDYLGRPGYPGWHLECSTIIHEELGEPIDIHTGGIDHIPVHHSNEIAQSFAVSGLELARYWLHCNFITIEGEKVSKSLGNVYTLDDLEKRGFSAMDYKMWVLSGHYQGERNFTFDSLAAAKTRRLNWRNRIAECYQGVIEQVANRRILDEIIGATENNLNSAEAFALIDGAKLDLEGWEKIDKMFGLRLLEDSPDVSVMVRSRIVAREKARQEKDFRTADRIRDELIIEGVALKDTQNGTIWQYI